MTIGQRIGELRKQHGYSQEYIAEKMNVSRQAVSKWEQDLSAPDTYNLIALAELLGVSVEYLATGKRPEAHAPEAAPETPSLAPQPVAHSGMNTQKIVGLILLGAGLLALILGCLFARTLVVISALLLLCGILCLIVRRHLGLVLLWTFLIIMFPVITMLTPVKVIGSPHLGTENTRIEIISLFFWLLFILAIVLTVVTIIKSRQNK